jgi:hypothetical protein
MQLTEHSETTLRVSKRDFLAIVIFLVLALELSTVIVVIIVVTSSTCPVHIATQLIGKESVHHPFYCLVDSLTAPSG